MNGFPKYVSTLLAACLLMMAGASEAAIVNATFNASTDVPVTATSYAATGNTVTFALNFAPLPGTVLTVVKNTGNGFIDGSFDNLAQLQAVSLNYNGISYPFVANYYGGSGNDLTLQWANTRLLGWGNNPNGTLGDGTTTNQLAPVAVIPGALAGKSILRVAAGLGMNIALAVDGTLAAWGYSPGNGNISSTQPVLVDRSGVLAGKTPIAIATGNLHELVLCKDGTLVAWGDNTFGQFGNGTTYNSDSPVATTLTGVLAGKTVAAISAGNSHTLALCTDGTLATWGRNNYGQLGTGNNTDSSVPVLVTRAGVLNGKTVSAISCGDNMALVLCTDGTLASWGINAEGQLGNGRTTNSSVPVLVNRTGVLNGKTVTAISAGGAACMVLCSDGSLATWGFNSSGQLGNGSKTLSSVPVLVTRTGVLSGKTVTAISCGDSHAAVLCSDGTLASWGSAFVGRLGNNSTTDSSVPVLVSTGNLTSSEVFSSVDCGFAQNMALAASLPLPVATTLAATTVRNSTATLNGTAISNGSAVSLAFEYGTTTAYGSTIVASPATLPGSGNSAASANLTDLIPGATYHFRLVATGAGGVTRGGDMTFTTNTNAVLSSLTVGQGTMWPVFSSSVFHYELVVPFATAGVRFTPTVANFGATVRVNGISVANGTASAPVSLAVGSQTIMIDVAAVDGINTCSYEVKVIRRPEVFTFASASEVPLSVGGLKASGSTVQFALNFAPPVGTNLTVVNNTGGQFIQGTFDNLTQGQRVDLTFSGVSYPFVANYFGGTGNDLVLQWANNRLVGWGYNTSGQLGTGTNVTLSQVPVAVSRAGILAGKTIISTAFGSAHQVALCSDGTVASWGANGSGQLGNNASSTNNVFEPVTVDRTGVLAGRTVIAVAAAGTHTLALCSDGRIAAWGANSRGALGTTSGTGKVPVLVDTTGVLAGRTVVAIATGGDISLALCSDGTLASWGYAGFLGRNATANSSVPVAVDMSGVLAGKTVTAIQSAAYHCLVLCSDGTLVAWGDNFVGGLGTTSTTFAQLPVLVDRSGTLAGKTVTSIFSRSQQNFVMCSDGTVASWGGNNLGQLGLGTITATPLPTVLPRTGALVGKSIAAVVPGGEHGLALCVDSTLVAWGRNDGGQLGNGTRTDSVTPVFVDRSFLGTGEKIVAIHSGSGTSGALVAIPPAPVVTTLAPTGIADSSAIFGASVSGNGSDTSISFEYGLTTDYGTSATALPATVTGTASNAITAAVSDLVPGTTYHYRVIAKSSGGTVVGNDIAFTTSVLATLSGLSSSEGTLMTAFSPARTNYSVTLPSGTNSIRLTPVVAFPGATVKVNGIPVGSGEPSGSIDLPFGTTLITVDVTAADGIDTLTYGVKATRLPEVFTFTSAAQLPVTVTDFNATGTVSFALNYAPIMGADLTLVNNAGYNSTLGTFTNLAQGQRVSLTYGGITYPYFANYFGGTGNDLVLQWGNSRLLAWGRGVLIPTAVDMSGALLGKSIVSMAEGGAHRLALCSDGTVVAWGYNGSGQLGINSTTDSAVPVQVNRSGVLAGKTVVAVAAGASYSLALCSDGTIASWGRNFEGQLGDRTTTTRLVPVLVDRSGVLAGKTVRAISAGEIYGLALCTDNTLVAWGSNSYNQLGNSSLTQSATPVEVNRTGALFGKTITSIAAGGYTSMALCSDGTVATWGYNGNGQLGTTFIVVNSSATPVPLDQTGILSGKTIVAIEGGGYHCLARCADGTVAVWGSNQNGELGINSTSTSFSYVPLPIYTAGTLSGKSIAAAKGGGAHTLALCTDGTMVSWGANSEGQLGNNSTAKSTVPVLVNSTALRAGERIVSMSANGGNLVLVASPLQTAISTVATAITGTNATLRGTVNANNNTPVVSFEYGLEATYGSTVTAIPASVSGSGNTAVSANISGLTPGTTYHFRVIAANYAGDAKSNDQTFTTLSDNAKLASVSLGTGSLSPSFSKATTDYIATVPFATSEVTLTPIKDHPGAMIKVNGTTVTSGTASGNISLPVGNSTITIAVTAEDTITTKTYSVVVTRLPQNLTFNSASDIPITANGFSTGGYPVNVVLGYAPTPGTPLTAVRNDDLTFIQGRFTNLAHGQKINLTFGDLTYTFVANYFGGNGNDLVLQWADTKAYGWGLNSYGQLGDSSTTRRLTPTAVDDSGVLLGKTITSLGSGYLHSLVLCSDGTLAAWGYNIYGQLGDGGNAPVTVPQAVNQSGVLSGRTVVAISAGPFHNLALCSDGSVAAWGYNNYGQLGTGDKITARSPILVSSSGALSGKQVVAVAAGAYSSFALCSDGTMAAWGYNDEGELGDNTTTSSLIPVAVNTSGVLSGKKVMTLSAGAYHTLALCTDGTLVSWGYNSSGQLGNNSTTFSKVPVAIQSSGSLAGKTVTALASGGSHSLALCSDGSLSAWGSNPQGQLGSSGASQIPKLVNLGAVGVGKSIARIAAGSTHSSVTFADGTAASWGGNSNGQLANNSTTGSYTPGAIDSTPFDPGSRLMNVSTGSASNHGIGLLALPSARASAQSAIVATNQDQDLSDPDHDGICNLLEYAFGLNPNADSSGLLPHPVMSDTSFSVSFVEPNEVIGLTYAAEWSPSLLPDSWTPLPDQGTGRNHLFSLPIQDLPKAFIRLKVTRP